MARDWLSWIPGLVVLLTICAVVWFAFGPVTAPTRGQCRRDHWCTNAAGGGRVVGDTFYPDDCVLPAWTRDEVLAAFSDRWLVLLGASTLRGLSMVLLNLLDPSQIPPYSNMRWYNSTAVDFPLLEFGRLWDRSVGNCQFIDYVFASGGAVLYKTCSGRDPCEAGICMRPAAVPIPPGGIRVTFVNFRYTENVTRGWEDAVRLTRTVDAAKPIFVFATGEWDHVFSPQRFSGALAALLRTIPRDAIVVTMSAPGAVAEATLSQAAAAGIRAVNRVATATAAPEEGLERKYGAALHVSHRVNSWDLQRLLAVAAGRPSEQRPAGPPVPLAACGETIVMGPGCRRLPEADDRMHWKQQWGARCEFWPAPAAGGTKDLG